MSQLLNVNKTHWIINSNISLASYFNACDGLTGLFSFISSLIFKRTFWQSQTFDENFTGLGYAHVYMMLSMLRNKDIKIYVENKPLVLCRFNDDILRDEGAVKRIMLDFNAYSRFAKFFYSHSPMVYNSFVNVVRKEHKLFTILYIKRTVSHDFWSKEVLPKLVALNYNRIYLKLISKSKFTQMLVRILEFSLRKIGLT